jgi:hypothetical protein
VDVRLRARTRVPRHKEMLCHSQVRHKTHLTRMYIKVIVSESIEVSKYDREILMYDVSKYFEHSNTMGFPENSNCPVVSN